MQKKPARAEFKIKKEGREVVHVPTGARYWSNPYSSPIDRRIVAKHEGNLASTLPNGDEYNGEEVQAMAERVLQGEEIA